MSLRLFLLERHVPEPIRRLMFGRLVRLTADAFGVPAPDLGRLPPDEGIDRFARFTRGEAERAIGAGPSSAVCRGRLFEGARAMGASIRRSLGVRRPDEAMRALRLLYGGIGIDLDGDKERGEIVVTRCAFARVYTPAVCDFISALDAGIVSGLTAGTAVVFTERITEGAPACRARLTGGARE
jgi:hypothetical protein